MLLFNPPYVPTEEEEVQDGQSAPNIKSSWAGGDMGMHITDVLLGQLDVSNMSALKSSSNPFTVSSLASRLLLSRYCRAE